MWGECPTEWGKMSRYPIGTYICKLNTYYQELVGEVLHQPPTNKVSWQIKM